MPESFNLYGFNGFWYVQALDFGYYHLFFHQALSL